MSMNFQIFFIESMTTNLNLKLAGNVKEPSKEFIISIEVKLIDVD